MKILIIDDQPSVLRTTAYALRTMGHEPLTAENSTAAWRVLHDEPIEAIFLDVKLGPEAGLDLLSAMRAAGVTADVIVFTAQASVETAVEAMRRGAYDYLSKPFGVEDIKQKLLLLVRTRQERARLLNFEGQMASGQPGILLDSAEPKVQRVLALAFQAADSAATLMILGPSGTGKTVLARAVHARSPRAAAPFVTINCPSLSRELLESELFGHVRGAFTGAIKDTWGKVAAAEGGTLFFDEIGEAPREIQAKLLRLLEERTYERVGETRTRRANIRVICATNRDLAGEVAAGRFREDLYYRLKVVSVVMPALVERHGDIETLVEHFLKFFAATSGRTKCALAPATVQALCTYDWPGNLRELRNVIERGVILATDAVITLRDLPDEIRTNKSTAIRPGYPVTLDQLEEAHVRQIMATAPTFERAASILGIDNATLYRKRVRMRIAALPQVAATAG